MNFLQESFHFQHDSEYDRKPLSSQDMGGETQEIAFIESQEIVLSGKTQSGLARQRYVFRDRASGVRTDSGGINGEFEKSAQH